MGAAIVMRDTKQRRAVTALMSELREFRSAQEIYDLLRERGDQIGLTTVYRTLQAMAENGEIDVLRTDDGEAIYRQCSVHHHHHLWCKQCGKAVEIRNALLEKWAQEVASEYGFTDVTHSIEVNGICPNCQESK